MCYQLFAQLACKPRARRCDDGAGGYAALLAIGICAARTLGDRGWRLRITTGEKEDSCRNAHQEKADSEAGNANLLLTTGNTVEVTKLIIERPRPNIPIAR